MTTTAPNERKTHQPLEAYERETIITFDETTEPAHIFTYNRSWQKHLEQKLGIEPTTDNEFGAREYECPKAWIRKPQKPRQLSEVQKGKLRERLADKAISTADLSCAVGGLGGGNGR